MSVAFDNLTARQIAELPDRDIFPDVRSALALIRVLAARVAELETRPITLTDESVRDIADRTAALLKPKDSPNG